MAYCSELLPFVALTCSTSVANATNAFGQRSRAPVEHPLSTLPTSFNSIVTLNCNWSLQMSTNVGLCRQKLGLGCLTAVSMQLLPYYLHAVLHSNAIFWHLQPHFIHMHVPDLNCKMLMAFKCMHKSTATCCPGCTQEMCHTQDVCLGADVCSSTLLAAHFVPHWVVCKLLPCCRVFLFHKSAASHILHHVKRPKDSLLLCASVIHIQSSSVHTAGHRLPQDTLNTGEHHVTPGVALGPMHTCMRQCATAHTPA